MNKFALRELLARTAKTLHALESDHWMLAQEHDRALRELDDITDAAASTLSAEEELALNKLECNPRGYPAIPADDVPIVCAALRRLTSAAKPLSINGDCEDSNIQREPSGHVGPVSSIRPVTPPAAKPVEGVQVDDAKDAARYRWLRQEMQNSAQPPLAIVVWKLHGNRQGHRWTNISDGLTIDSDIDAAIQGGS